MLTRTLLLVPLLLTLPALGDWTDISTPLVTALTADNKKPAWPGQSAGVTVDRTTGDVYLVVPGQGLFKSTDRAATFARCDDGKVTGRCETAFSLHPDPNSARLACFMLDGKCALTTDAAKTWTPFKDVGRNWDFAAVDWNAAAPQTIFALAHESGGQLYLSTNAGGAWSKLEKDPRHFALGVVDANTLILSKGEGLLRSGDQGRTWTKVSDLTPVSRVMQTFGSTHYFFAKDPAAPATAKSTAAILIASKDKGATWSAQGTAAPGAAAWGPCFGKDDRHVVSLTMKGKVIESADAGQTWTEVTGLPATKEYTPSLPGWFINLGYDPAGDTFYVSRMGQPAYKFARAK